MDFTIKCIACGTSDNLNAMSIDNTKFALCTEHQDTLSMKQIKELIQKKSIEASVIIESLQKAKELGIDLSQFGINLPTAVSAPAQTKSEETKKVVKKLEPARKIAAVKAPSGCGLENHNSINIENEMKNITENMKKKLSKRDGSEDVEITIPSVESVETQEVAGRMGLPIIVPKKIKHNTGETTTIRVVKTSHDDVMKYTKRLEQNAPTGNHPKECLFCNGTGEKQGKDCKKCDGKGII